MKKKALKKLDEFIKYDGNSLQSFIQFFELREILKSLYDDIEEAFYQTPNWARNFENRIARLEELCHEHAWDKDTAGYKEPSNPHECKFKIKKTGDMLLGTCECGSGFSEVLNLSKPITEEKPCVKDTEHKEVCVKNDKRDERVEELAKVFHSIYQAEAERQGDKRHPDDYADLPEGTKNFDRVLAEYVLLNFSDMRARNDKPSEPMAHYSKYGVEIGKPSEFISIPRSVAEDYIAFWERIRSDYDVTIERNLAEAIKQALKG